MDNLEKAKMLVKSNWDQRDDNYHSLVILSNVVDHLRFALGKTYDEIYQLFNDWVDGDVNMEDYEEFSAKLEDTE